MSKHLFTSLMTSALVLSSAALAADFRPRSVEVALDRAYVPVGYDDNDQVQIAVSGVMPDTCHRIAATRVEPQAGKIVLHQIAYRYGGVCAKLSMGFSETVELGVLDKGKYEIVDGLSHKTIGSITIEEASSEYADENLYAPVSDAYLYRDDRKQKTMLHLSGTFRSSCLKLKEVRLQPYPDVLVVLPIAEADGTPCNAGRFRFSKEVEVLASLKPDWLLHVRTMQGRAINKLQELPLIAGAGKAGR